MSRSILVIDFYLVQSGKTNRVVPLSFRSCVIDNFRNI